MWQQLENALTERGIAFRTEVATATLCSFRIGGRCRVVIEPLCTDELLCAVELCQTLGVPFAVLGRGSNVLFDDGALPLALILTRRLCGVQFEGESVTALCGTPLPQLCRDLAARGLAGLAFAAGIPGSVGGAVFMNAGAHGREISDVLTGAWLLSPTEKKVVYLHRDELRFSYRHSRLQEESLVLLKASFALHSADKNEIYDEMAAGHAFRRATQPVGLPSAGSVFRRLPNGLAVAKLIDELGLKGFSVGDAAVSEKHAGFIINRGNATARDVKLLIDYIKNELKTKKGITPECEIRFLP